MGIYVKGVFGAFSGKVGNVVGSSWRSVDYLRSRPKPTKKNATPKQRAQRTKFALAIEFLSPMRQLINIGFNDKNQKKMTAFNQATNELLFKIKGEHPDFTIPYQDVKFSKGSLEPVRASLGEDATGSPVVKWSVPTKRFDGLPSDVVYVILYNAAKQDFFVFQESVRADGECAIDPEGMGTGEFHIWVVVANENATKSSASRYLETITI